MAKQLNGSELAGFIKERQAKAVRGLVQAQGVQPKLAILVTVEEPVIEIYMKLKKRYGQDIGVGVEICRVAQKEVLKKIAELNRDSSVHGIIVQLPLQDPAQTDEVCNAIAPAKDVDALGVNAALDPATPTAILWLLAGYGVDLKQKKVVLVGRGKLVGEPLEKMLKNSGVEVTSCDENDDLNEALANAEVIVTATGVPGLITAKMIPQNTVVVDAGVAVEQGRALGDLEDSVYDRQDISVTPRKGGVGPLTVCALFENVIQAARTTVAEFSVLSS